MRADNGSEGDAVNMVERAIRTLIARTRCEVIGGNNWKQEVCVLTADGLRLNVDIDHLDVQGFIPRKPYDADDNARRDYLKAVVQRARFDLLGGAGAGMT